MKVQAVNCFFGFIRYSDCRKRINPVRYYNQNEFEYIDGRQDFSVQNER